MTSGRTWALNCQKYNVCCVHWIHTPQPKSSSVSHQLFSRYKGVENRMISNRSWALNCRKYTCIIEYLPPRPNFHFSSLYDDSFGVNCSFLFPYMLQWWAWHFKKEKRKINSQFHKSITVLLWGPRRRKFRRSFEKKIKRDLWEWRFGLLPPIRVPC